MYRANHPDDPGMHISDQFTDSHTRVSYKTNPGFLDRIAGSCAAAVLGIILVVVAFHVLFLNEGRAVQTAIALDEGLKAVIPLGSHIDENYEKYDNKLVHLSGKLQTDMVLSDGDYGVAVRAVKLKREAAMYQWVEHKSTKEYNEGDKTREETTYSYSKEWRTQVVSSHEFDKSGHQNPSSIPISSYVKLADPVHVGAFRLSKALVNKIDDFQNLHVKEIPSGLGDVTIRDGVFYHSHDPFSPRIGDVRVSFSYAGLSGKSRLGEPLTVSIIARQDGKTLSSYETSSGHSLELLYTGELSAKEIFDAEQSANTALTWAIRVLGWFLLFIGFIMMTSILTTLVSWIPIVRELVGLGVTLICLCLATSLSLVTIAVGWIVYRPLLGMALLTAAAVPFVLSRFRRTEKKKEFKH